MQITPHSHTFFFFYIGCHLSRTNIHFSVSVNIITWLVSTLVRDACFIHSFMLESVSMYHHMALRVSQRSSFLSFCLYVCEWMTEREAKSGLCGLCLMEKDIRTLQADWMFIFLRIFILFEVLWSSLLTFTILPLWPALMREARPLSGHQEESKSHHTLVHNPSAQTSAG